jgi:hypothetical protein
MTTIEVEHLVRTVIVERGLPFALLSVNGSPAGWNIEVRAATRGVVRLHLVGGRPVAMRVAIQEALEASF